MLITCFAKGRLILLILVFLWLSLFLFFIHLHVDQVIIHLLYLLVIKFHLHAVVQLINILLLVIINKVLLLLVLLLRLSVVVFCRIDLLEIGIVFVKIRVYKLRVLLLLSSISLFLVLSPSLTSFATFLGWFWLFLIIIYLRVQWSWINNTFWTMASFAFLLVRWLLIGVCCLSVKRCFSRDLLSLFDGVLAFNNVGVDLSLEVSVKVTVDLGVDHLVHHRSCKRSVLVVFHLHSRRSKFANNILLIFGICIYKINQVLSHKFGSVILSSALYRRCHLLLFHLLLLLPLFLFLLLGQLALRIRLNWLRCRGWLICCLSLAIDIGLHYLQTSAINNTWYHEIGVLLGIVALDGLLLHISLLILSSLWTYVLACIWIALGLGLVGRIVRPLLGIHTCKGRYVSSV